ncbi:MAG: hypothetical protein JWR12_1056 [Mucilaginibacter sp.]|nr:hypothetical protein [Mucilaginibacter sp.]
MKPCLFLAFLVTFYLKETSAQQHSQIKKQAEEYSEAMIKHDYNRWIYLMYPKELTITGGRDSFLNIQRRIEKSGTAKIKAIIVGHEGNIVREGKRLFCMLNDTLYMTGAFNIKGHVDMIALSEDNGKRWYFIDTDWAFRILFPDIEKKMPIRSVIISSSPVKSN